MKVSNANLLALSIISGLTVGVQATETLTLYTVAEPATTQNTNPNDFSVNVETISHSVSAINRQGDGKTVYEDVMALTNLVIGNGFATQTFTSNIPQITTRTFVEDASGLEQTYTIGASGNQLIVAQSCTFEGTTAGSCQETDIIEIPGVTTSTRIAAFTGIPQPYLASGAVSHWTSGASVFLGTASFMGAVLVLRMGLGL